MSKFLIRGGTVLSMDQSVGNHRQADLVIEDDRIVEVGPGLRARDAEVVDASRSIVMPGFVDTHRHVWESLLRGMGAGADSDPATTFGPHYSGDDIYASTLVGLLGAAQAGITTVVDWADIPAEFVGAALEAHADSRVGTVFAPAGATWAGRGGAAWREALARAIDSAAGGRLAAAPPGIDAPERLASDWTHARDLGLRIHAHLAGVRPGEVAGTGRRGLLQRDVTVVHCSALEDADFDAIAAAGASVSIAPPAEMIEGQPPPPVQKMIDRDIRPGLAVGTERIAPGDLFAPMRAAISLQHAHHFDLKLAGKGGLPGLLNTRQVLRYATIDGARAVGLDQTTGSLTPGKQADVLVLRADRPNIAPVNDPIGAVVWGMDTSNVDWVFSRGQALVRGGRSDADVAQATERARSSRRRVMEAAGLMARIGGDA